MYNPTAYWGQQSDLTASVLANYRGTGGTISYTFNGATQSATIIAANPGYNTFCMDIKSQTAAYNPLDQGPEITSTPFFGNSNSNDGKSDFVRIPEAWYVKITNTSGLPVGCIPYTIQFSYIDQNGVVQLLQLASPNSTTIITQNIGWNFFTETIACYGRDYDVEVISKYTGNVVAYPYINVPIRYVINPATLPISGFYGKYLFYQQTGSNGGVIQSGSLVTFDTGSAIMSTNFPAIYNLAQGGTANQTNLALIPTGSPLPKLIYKLTNCVTSTGTTASFTDWSNYQTGSILSVSSSAVSGCFTINSVTSSITPTYTDVSVLNTYTTNCTECLWSASVPIYYLTNCNTSTAITASINNYVKYPTGSTLYISTSFTNDCYIVNNYGSAGVIPEYTNVNITENFSNCVACNNRYFPNPLPTNLVSGGLVIYNSTSSFSGSVWYDQSGNGNNAVVSGSTITTSGSLGWEFNGTNNFLTYPATLLNTPTENWTMQMYVTMYNTPGTNRDLFCKDYYNDGWDTIWQPLGTGSRFIFRDVAPDDKFMNYQYTSGSKVLVTITADSGTNITELYINNTYITSGSGIGSGEVGPFTASTLPLKFGWNSNLDATFFKGTVSSLLLYNKVLSASEVSTNYTVLSSL